MRDIWVISDTHFQHANILTFRDGTSNELVRGNRFSTVEEMDECMMDNWNSVVKPGDKVYHLGDVMFGSKEEFLPKFKKLNGQKRLILGNHDDAKWMVKHEMFAKVDVWRMFPEFGLLLTHIPVHNSTLGEGRFKGSSMINIHGHIHQNPSPSEQHRCVCVEHIDYTPINIEELAVKLR
jgi:calcineurin-like phosphoesterase family protein